MVSVPLVLAKTIIISFLVLEDTPWAGWLLNWSETRLHKNCLVVRDTRDDSCLVHQSVITREE